MGILIVYFFKFLTQDHLRLVAVREEDVLLHEWLLTQDILRLVAVREEDVLLNGLLLPCIPGRASVLPLPLIALVRAFLAFTLILLSV
jgi:hypothetical protein